MTDQLLQWDDVRLFLSLMKEGSLTHAAKQCGLDVSTMSRRLTVMEERLGTTLFLRSREGVRPTAAAEELVADAEVIDEAISRLQRRSAGFEVAPEGLVRLTAPPLVVETLVVPLLPRLLETWPKLRLEVLSSQAVLDLTRREADLAIRTVKPSSGELVVVKLLEAPYAFFSAHHHARRYAKTTSLDGLPIVTWNHEGSMIPAARWVNEHAKGANVVLRSNSLAAQIEAVRYGVGVGLLPQSIARAIAGLAQLSLRGLPPFPADVLWLVGHQALKRVPRVQAVWDFFRSAVEATPAETHLRRLARPQH